MRVDRQTVVGVRLDAVPRLFSLVKRVYVDDRPAEVSHLVGEGVFDVPGDFVARLLDLFKNARLHCVVNFAALQVREVFAAGAGVGEHGGNVLAVHGRVAAPDRLEAAGLCANRLEVHGVYNGGVEAGAAIYNVASPVVRRVHVVVSAVAEQVVRALPAEYVVRTCAT